MAKALGRRTLLNGCVVTMLATGAHAQDDAITLGGLYNETGPQAVLDLPSVNGARLGIAAINAAGGINGRPLEMAIADGDSSPESWPALIEQLLEDHPQTVALFGLSDSDNAREAGTAAAAKGRLFITSGATSPKLPNEVPQYLYLAPFGDNTQAAVAAEWAYQDAQARNVAVLFDPNETYPVLLKDYFIERFEKLGGAILSIDEIAPRTASPTVPGLSDVDLVFLSVETAEDAAKMLRVVRGAGYRGPILGGDGYDAAAVWAEHPNTNDVYFTTHVYLGPDNPNPRVQEFISAYTEAYQVAPTAFSALSYDTVGILASALGEVDDVTPVNVLGAVQNIENFDGITGTISYRPGVRIPLKSVTIMEVVDGQHVFVAEKLPQSVPDN